MVFMPFCTILLNHALCIYPPYGTHFRACMYVVQQTYHHIIQCKHQTQAKILPPAPRVNEDLNVSLWLIPLDGYSTELCVCIVSVILVGLIKDFSHILWKY
jgi:hypothetical protein